MTCGRSAIVWLLCVLAMSCGPAACPAAGPRADVPCGVVRVACLGDSITAGARVDARTQSYPARLQEILGKEYVVRNFGIGGATLLKKGRPNVWQALPKAKAFLPHVVVVSLGTNDTVGGRRKNWERIGEFDGDCQALIDELAALSTGPRILLCTPTDMVLTTPGLSAARKANLEERRPRLLKLCQQIRDLARKQPHEKNVGVLELHRVLRGKPKLLTPGDGVHPNAAGYQAVARAVAPHVQRSWQRPEDGYVQRHNSRTLEQIDKIHAGMPPVTCRPAADRWQHLTHTMAKLREGPELRVVMLGDSIIADTSRSAWNLLVQRTYPKCRIVKITSVRGSTGCWWYKDNSRVWPFVLDHAPDLVVIGGISQGRKVDAIREVIRQIRKADEKVEFLLMTGPFGRADPNAKTWSAAIDPKGNGYNAQLLRLAGEMKVEFFDLRGAWGRAVQASGKDVTWFKRDVVHANEKGEQILGRILEAYFAPK